MIEVVRRHPIFFAAIAFVLGTVPQWFSSVWYLFCSRPPYAWFIEKTGGRVTLPSFSANWITTPLAALLFALVVVLVLRKPREKKEKYRPRYELEDKVLREAVPNWITNWLAHNGIKAQRAILFGSIAHDHFPTSDVDLIVLSERIGRRQAVSMGRKIKTLMRGEFQQRFGHKLHVQLFLHNEAEGLEAFLKGLSNYEEIRLK